MNYSLPSSLTPSKPEFFEKLYVKTLRKMIRKTKESCLINALPLTTFRI